MRSNDLLNQDRLSANYPERTSPLDGREFSRQPGAIIGQTCFRRQSPLLGIPQPQNRAGAVL